MAQYGVVLQILALVQRSAPAHACIRTSVILELSCWGCCQSPSDTKSDCLLSLPRAYCPGPDSCLTNCELDCLKLAITMWPTWAAPVRLRLQAHCQWGASTWTWSFNLQTKKTWTVTSSQPWHTTRAASTATSPCSGSSPSLFSWTPVPSSLAMARPEEAELLASGGNHSVVMQDSQDKCYFMILSMIP